MTRKFWINLVLFMACWAAQAAHAGCGSITVTYTPAGTVVSSTVGAGTFATGVVNVTALDCVNGAFGGYYFWFPYGSTPQVVAGTTNVSIATNGAASTTASSGSTNNDCSNMNYNAQNSNAWTSGTVTAVFFGSGPAPAGIRCNHTISLPIRFTKAAGGVSGTASPGVSPTGADNPHAPSWVGQFNAGWPTQDGTPLQSGNLTAGLTFVQALCTLGFTTNGAANTVVLPNVGAASLAVDGASTGETPFVMKLSSCSNSGASPVAVSASWGFPFMSGMPTLVDTGVAHLAVQLQCGGTILSSGTPVAVTSLSAGLANGSSNQTCSAKYVASGGAASPGTFSVPIGVSLTYQ